MAVSRKGKRGRRAGGKTHRPAGRNGRVRGNAISANIAKVLDDRPTSNRRSKEEWVIRRVAEIVGTSAGRGFVRADDVASDIILALFNAGGFQWEDEEIEEFCRRKSAFMVRAYLGRRERNECEFYTADGEYIPTWEVYSYAPARQEAIAEANEAIGLLRAIPNRQREALEILCDGGNPIDVAEELGITPWAAIALIKEGREYVDRVDPL